MQKIPVVPVTIALIAISVAVTFFSQFGKSEDMLAPFLMADARGGWTAIASGEVWRLITPIFIHFSLLHILFNMMWMWDLGKLVETRRGAVFLASFVLIDGVVSNVAQYLMTDNPMFGGMSGVVYGLLGFVWMQGRYNPQFGYALTKPTVVMMLACFVSRGGKVPVSAR
jgi:GlpG protein